MTGVVHCISTHSHTSHACHVIREQLRLESEQLMKELREARRQKEEEERDLAKKEAGGF